MMRSLPAPTIILIIIIPLLPSSQGFWNSLVSAHAHEAQRYPLSCHTQWWGDFLAERNDGGGGEVALRGRGGRTA